jgi:hypothetical protein
MMGRWIGTAVLAAALAMLAGCASLTAPRYTASADNVVALRGLAPARVALGPFAGPATASLKCRGYGYIAPPDGLSFAEYVRRALESELKLAGVYDPNAPAVTLGGRLDEATFSSANGSTSNGFWDLALTLASSNGATLAARERYGFTPGYLADSACKQTAEALVPAVQDLVAKLVGDPRFRSLLAARNDSTPPTGGAPASGTSAPPDEFDVTITPAPTMR